MRKIFMQKSINIWKNKASRYGFIYLSLVPLYSLVYLLIPIIKLNIDATKNFWNCLYFSVVTITTLGYGDILPKNDITQIITASESILGIILIGLFLNALSHRQSEIIKEHEEKKFKNKNYNDAVNYLLAYHNIIQINIQNYYTYVYPIITPIDNRKNDVNINKNFVFTDMRDLFLPTMRTSDNLFEPAIKYYFDKINILRESIENLVVHGHLKEWFVLENLCIDFIKNCKKYDFSEFILSQPNKRIKTEKSSELDVKLIASHKGEVEYKKGNSINAYVSLFKLIKHSFSFLEEYENKIKEIAESRVKWKY